MTKTTGEAVKSDGAVKSDVKLISVTFLKHHTPYNKGEVAGFEKDYAEWLVDKKIAKLNK